MARTHVMPQFLQFFIMWLCLSTRRTSSFVLCPASTIHQLQKLSPRLFPKRSPITNLALSSDSTSRVEADALRTLDSNIPLANFGGIRYWDTSNVKRFRVVFVLGGPGAGKGTQCTLIEEHYPTAHLSVGQLLREEQTKESSPHRILIEEALVSGKIVPVEISLALLKRRMEEIVANNGGNWDTIFLVDGFPRNFNNLFGFCTHMADSAAMWGVLVYKCPLDVLQARIMERAKSSGRSDDNMKSAEKRFMTFERETVPVIEMLRTATMQNADKQWSVIDIQGNQSLDDVWLDSQQVFNQLVMHDILTANSALLAAVEAGDADRYQSLCDSSWFEGDNCLEEVLVKQEGKASPTGAVDCAQLEVISGRHVAVSYDRTLQGQRLKEKRIWTHQGPKGWQNIHFSRMPLLQ